MMRWRVFTGTAASRLSVKDWRVHHWQYFLTQLPEVVSQVQLMDLDETFRFTNRPMRKLPVIGLGWRFAIITTLCCRL